MKQGSLRSSAYAVLTAFIWGTAFVAQSVGMEYIYIHNKAMPASRAAVLP